MKVYQVSYDLRNQRNYDALYERIKSYGNWCHALESSWIIATNQSASEVTDHLLPAIDKDDGLLVTRLTGEAAWYGVNPKVSEWLKSELSRAAA